MSGKDTIIREVANGIVTFSRPFLRFGFIPFGGRSTAIKLSNGGVWVLASTQLDPPTKTKIDEMGPVKYIVSPDAVHHLFLSEFQKAYPEAKVIAPHAVQSRIADKELKFHGAWGKDDDGTEYGFENDIKHQHFPGHANKEVAFLHIASKSLIEADLLFNLKILKPNSWLHKSMVKATGSADIAAMKRDAKVVDGWDFDRIIPCHGDIIETGGKKAWRDAFEAFLD